MKFSLTRACSKDPPDELKNLPGFHLHFSSFLRVISTVSFFSWLFHDIPELFDTVGKYFPLMFVWKNVTKEEQKSRQLETVSPFHFSQLTWFSDSARASRFRLWFVAAIRANKTFTGNFAEFCVIFPARCRAANRKSNNSLTVIM